MHAEVDYVKLTWRQSFVLFFTGMGKCGNFTGMRMSTCATVMLCLLTCCHRGTMPVHRTQLISTPALQRHDDVLSLARRQMEEMAPQISFTLSGGNAYNRAYEIADTLLRDGAAVSFRIQTRGNEVILEPRYADNELLWKAHQSEAVRATLTDAQRRALEVARKVVRDVCATHSGEYERALALHDFLVLNSTYNDSLSGQDTANATTRLLLSGQGVCDAYTRAYKLMLNIAGIKNIFVAGVAQGENHCWNLVCLEGRWVHVDCTYSDPMPDEPGRLCHTHFALPDSLLAADHKWNHSAYPAATSAELYYPMRYHHFPTMRDLLVWLAYESQPHPHVTAYVEELSHFADKRSGAQFLIEQAHVELNAHIIRSFSVEEHLPGVIVCKIR